MRMRHAITPHAIRPSFTYLIQEAIRRGIVKSYRETPSYVQLVIRESVFKLDPEHARMLLSNRLRAEDRGCPFIRREASEQIETA